MAYGQLTLMPQTTLLERTILTEMREKKKKNRWQCSFGTYTVEQSLTLNPNRLFGETGEELSARLIFQNVALRSLIVATYVKEVILLYKIKS